MRFRPTLVNFLFLSITLGAVACGDGVDLAPLAPDAGRASVSSDIGAVHLALPEPTGPYAVGTISLHLVDATRQDPFWLSPHPRELMVTLWYPTRVSAAASRLAPWMSAATLAYYRPRLEDFLSHDAGVGDGGGGIICSPEGCPPPGGADGATTGMSTSGTVSLDNVLFPMTHARQGAPVEQHGERYPVVVYSPGFAFDREEGTGLAEDLASHGYVVVSISHTYEASEVEFPNHRVVLGRTEEPPARDPNIAVMVRTADVRFVLDKLDEIVAGKNPDAERRVLPPALRASLDMNKIGIYGHSLGGATAAQSVANDDRITAGINLDGSFLPGKATTTPQEDESALIELASRIHRPFMVLADGGSGPHIPGPDGFGVFTSIVYYHLPAWRRFVQIAGTTHGSFTDDEWLISQLAAGGIVPRTGPLSAVSWIGTLPADRAVAIERTYITAFFDLWLKDTDNHLLDGLAAEYPEVTLYR